MSGGSGYSQQFDASNQLAGILGQQWANYQSVFKPVENKLIDYATNPDTITNATANAKTNVDNAFATSSGGLQRQLSAQGVQVTPEQQTAITRQNGLSKSLAEVGAMNQSANTTYDTITSVLSGGAPNMSGLQGALSQGGGS